MRPWRARGCRTYAGIPRRTRRLGRTSRKLRNPAGNREPRCAFRSSRSAAQRTRRSAADLRERPADDDQRPEPQRLRGSTEAPKFQCQTLPEVDWGALWLVSCNRLLGGGRVGEGTHCRCKRAAKCDRPRAATSRLPKASRCRVQSLLGEAIGKEFASLEIAFEEQRVECQVVGKVLPLEASDPVHAPQNAPDLERCHVAVGPF